MTLLHTEINTDSQDFTLDQQSYSKLIDYMNTLTPFEAIRYAAEINKMNGFEVVSRVEVAEWKSKMRNEKSKYEFQIMKNENMKSQNMKSKNSKVGNSQSDFSDNEIVNIEIQNIKAADYQKAYMSMLSM